MRIVVVGGGVAGLAAAHRIVAQVAGAEVVVLEAAARAGGVLRSEVAGGWLHEHAASAFLSGSPDGAVALCRELGVALDEATPAAKKRWIFVDNRLHELPSGPAALATTTLLSARAKLTLLGEPLRRRRREDAGDESVYDFVARRLGPEVARKIAAPFVSGVFAGDAQQISMRAGFPRLAALEDAGGIVRGMFAGRGAGRERSRSLAPVGGAEALTAALETKLGARIRLGVRVTAVTRTGSGVDLAIAGAPAERADVAVLAVPAWTLPPLLDEIPSLAAAAAWIDYAPVAIAFLGWRRDQLRHPLDGFGVLVAAGETPRLLGAVFESSIWPARAPADHVLVRCILGGTRDPRALDLDDAALIAQARRDLGALFGLDAAPIHTAVVRHRRGVAQYPLGHRDHVAAADEVARTHRLVLTGSAWHGIAVTDCVSDATRVATEVQRWA